MSDILYHYTNQSALIEILRGKSLWASSACFLNDSLEYTYALSLMKNLTDEELSNIDSGTSYYRFLKMVLNYCDHPHFPHFFVFSMCEDGDLLSMWRGYGAGCNGFAIGFRHHELESFGDREGYELVQCIYDLNDQKELIRVQLHVLKRDFLDPADKQGTVAQNAVDKLLDSNFINWFSRLAAMIKNPKFKEEREWRLISGPMTFKAISKDGMARVGDTTIHFRPGRSTLVPYKIISFGKSNEEDSELIDEIVIGPTQERELAVAAIHSLLSQFKLPANIRVSEVPYRTW